MSISKKQRNGKKRAPTKKAKVRKNEKAENKEIGNNKRGTHIGGKNPQKARKAPMNEDIDR